MGVVSLEDSMAVEWLEVNGAMWLARFLRAHNHPVAPGNRGADGDRLNHSKVDVLVKASLHVILPVNRDRYRSMEGHWAGMRIDHQAQWWTRHHGE